MVNRLRPHTFRVGEEHAPALNRLMDDLRGNASATSDGAYALERRVETLSSAVLDQTVGPGGGCLWKWDGVSTSQFGTTTLTTPTGGSAALSVATSATLGDSLRITCSALQGRWFVPILGFAMPRRGTLRFRVTPSAVNSNNMIAVMLFHNNTASNLYGVELSQSSSTSLQSYKCEAGSFTVSGGTGGFTVVGPQAAWPGNWYEIDWITVNHQPYQAAPQIGIRARVTAQGDQSDSQLSSDYSFGSWAGITGDGIALGANADALASSITLDFQDLAVYAHPLDRGGV